MFSTKEDDMSTYFLLVLWKKNGYKVSQFGSTLSFLELRTSSSSSTFRELFLSVYYITFSIYGKPWPAMWYSSSSWRQSWACLPSTCVVTCFAGIGMMWMNVQCHIIISSTTSLSKKRAFNSSKSCHKNYKPPCGFYFFCTRPVSLLLLLLCFYMVFNYFYKKYPFY